MGKLSVDFEGKPYHPDKETIIRELFGRFYRPLVLYACEYVHNREQAKDIVQDFFVRLWDDNYLLNINPDKIAAYLYTSVRNSCLTFLSKKDVMRNTTEIMGSEMPADLTVQIDEDTLRKAREILDKLPPRTREAIEYVIMKEYSYMDAAEEMGISVNTIKFLLKDGMRRARKISPTIAFIFSCLLPK